MVEQASLMRTRNQLIAVLVVAALGATVMPAQAQTARPSSGGGNNPQLLQQLQQLASERTALQAENARMKRELDEIRKERDTLKTGQKGLAERARASELALSRTNRESESSEREVAELKTRMQELIAKFRETAQTLRDVETQNTSARQTLVEKERALNVCIDRNVALYKLNDEVLTRLDGDGMFSRLGRAEPFTQIKRVQLENLIDEYKDRADQQIATPAAQPAVTTKAPNP
jgi:prefoldin subunit 5